MEMDRRQFVSLTIGMMICGCASGSKDHVKQPMPAKAGTPVDVGPEESYSKEGIYDAFADRGFFLVRHGEDLFAVASICTHRNCKLKPQRDQTILCPCHGSKFDLDGKVTRGPATRDLPHFQTHIDDRGHLLVTLKTA